MTETPRASLWAWLIAALFIIIGLGYDSLTPIFEQSDETLHYPYVKQLADGHGLPLAIPGQLWNQEGTQHPLYYAIVAATTFWIDSDNLPDFLQRNPHWRFTEVRALLNDNQNLVLHGPQDAFPYRRAALAIHIGRWWSLLFGLLTVLGTFWLARYLFPDNLPLVLTATALTAFNPQFLRVSATVSNDSLSAALTTLTVLVALKVTDPSYTQGSRGVEAQGSNSIFSPLRRRAAAPLLLGLLCGLALLTKLSSITAILVVGLILLGRLFLFSELHDRPLRTLLGWSAVIGLVIALLTGWWFWRNYLLYGEWLATETHLNLAGRGDLSLGAAWGLRAEIERAYWATFGWGQIRPPEWVHQLLFWFTRIGLIGLLLGLIIRLGQGLKGRPLPFDVTAINFGTITLLFVWAALNVILYFRWVMVVGSVSHSRLMFPAIAAISLLLALGWHTVLPRRLGPWLSGTVLAGLLALNGYSLGGLLYPAFTPDEKLATETVANPLDLTFLDSLTLTGAQLYAHHRSPEAPKPERAAGPGDVVIVDSTWRVQAPLDKNYSLAVVLLAPDGSVLARRETYPGLGLRPTIYLQPGDTFRDRYPLRLTGPLTEPLVAQATINLFDVETATRAGFPAIDATGQTVTPRVGQIKLLPDPWPVYDPQQPVTVTFAESIALVGYDLTTDPSAAETASARSDITIATDSSPRLTLYWESLAPVEQDYVLFVHLLDETGEIIAQADAPPTGNAYPTSWWAAGEIIADRRSLPPTPEAVAVRFGLYDLTTGQRLPISESSLPVQDNAVEIQFEE